MALCRILNKNFFKILSAKCGLKYIETRITPTIDICFTQERSFNHSFGAKLRVFKLRRKLAGPERIRKRSEWDNWNYKAELFAFNRRLHENISEETLRRAFMHESYIIQEEQKRKELDIPALEVPLHLKSNESLIIQGKEIASDFLKRYLRHCYQLLPEEGILALHDHLLSAELLSYVSSNLGTKDLILAAEYPPENNTLATTLLAVIGSIANDDSVNKAEKFVLDFICMQLVAKDVFEIWDLSDPSCVLNEILQRHGMSKYEPRLIFESGRNTIESIYNVGLYSDKRFLGCAFGETLDIAEELAAYNCLRKLFQIRAEEKPLSSKQIMLEELRKISSNPLIEEWYSNNLKLQKFL